MSGEFKTKDDTEEYAYSFALVTTGWTIQLIAAPVFFVGAGKNA